MLFVTQTVALSVYLHYSSKISFTQTVALFST